MAKVDSKQITDKPTRRDVEFLADLRKKVSADWTDIQTWRNEQTIANDQRMGEKRFTNTPYEGAPDIPLPQTDKLIKKGVPNLVLSSWKPKDMARIKLAVGEQPVEDQDGKIERCELYLNSLLRSRDMNWFKKQMLAADAAKTTGHCLFKVEAQYDTKLTYNEINLDTFDPLDVAAFRASTKTEKIAFLVENYDLDADDDKETIDSILEQLEAGDKIIKYTTERIKLKPNIEVPLVTNVFVPPYTTDLDNAERITAIMYLSKREILENMREGVFEKKDLDQILAGKDRNTNNDIVEQNKADHEGTTDNSKNSDLYKIMVVNTWYEPQEGKPAQRWVFMYLEDVQDGENSLIYSKPFHFEFDGWDYEKYDDEVKDPRYYNSRGIPKRIRAIQEVMERSVNNMLIRDELNNTPIWEVQGASELLDNFAGFAPGEKVPVSELGAEIRQLNQMPTVDQSSERIMAQMKAYAEEYTSSNDQLFSNSINSGGADTLGELKTGVALNQGTLNVDVINWNNTLSRVYQKLFEIIKERLVDPVYIDGIEITPDDFQFNAEVVSNGSVEYSQEQLMLNKAMNRIAMVERFMQAGIADQEDYYNAAKDFLQRDGVMDVDKFTTNPMEIMKTQLAQLQQQLQQMQMQAEQIQEANIKATKEMARTKKADIKGRIMNIAEAEEMIKSARAKAQNNDLSRSLDANS